MELSTIKSQLASGLRLAIQTGTGVSVTAFSFMPTKLGALFESIPVVLVDDHPENIDLWDDTDQAQHYTVSLLVQLFCELSEGDDGAASDTLIHQMKEYAEAYLVEKLTDAPFRGRIAASKVEGVAVEVTDTGIRMRYAWLRLDLRRFP